MALMEWEKVDHTALVRMTNNQNKMDLNFAGEMLQIFDEVLADESLKSLVLTSSDAKFFSMGVHVDWLTGRLRENDTASVKKFLFDMQEVFKKISESAAKFFMKFYESVICNRAGEKMIMIRHQIPRY